jgi:hypothetical protein
MAKHAKNEDQTNATVDRENLQIAYRGLLLTKDEYFELLRFVLDETYPKSYDRVNHPADLATAVASCNESILATTEWYNKKWRETGIPKSAW